MIKIFALLGLLSLASASPALSYGGSPNSYGGGSPVGSTSGSSVSGYLSGYQSSSSLLRSSIQVSSSLGAAPDCSSSSSGRSFPFYGPSSSTSVSPISSNAIGPKSSIPPYMSPNSSYSIARSGHSSSGWSSKSIAYGTVPGSISRASPQGTALAHVSTVTVITSVYTTICPATATHISSGHVRPSTYWSVSTVTSTYHVTISCAECGSSSIIASSYMVTTNSVSVPYPAGNSTAPTFSPARSTFSMGSSTRPSIPAYQTTNGGAARKPTVALLAAAMGVALLC